MKNQMEYYENKLLYEIDSSDLFEALNRGEKIIVVDARKPNGYDVEHIPGAINLPHREMTLEATRNFDKRILYVTYCDGIGCNASTKGALNLSRLGFQVKELIGGLDWWKRDEYATEGSHGVERTFQVSCAC